MRKNIFLVLLLAFWGFSSCSKNKNEDDTNDHFTEQKYDTIAIDSFSQGATSVDVARKIRISSQHYQDSLKENLKILAAEKLAKKEIDDKKMEDEKKKLEKEQKKEKENPLPENIPTEISTKP